MAEQVSNTSERTEKKAYVEPTLEKKENLQSIVKG